MRLYNSATCFDSAPLLPSSNDSRACTSESCLLLPSSCRLSLLRSSSCFFMLSCSKISRSLLPFSTCCVSSAIVSFRLAVVFLRAAFSVYSLFSFLLYSVSALLSKSFTLSIATLLSSCSLNSCFYSSSQRPFELLSCLFSRSISSLWRFTASLSYSLVACSSFSSFFTRSKLSVSCLMTVAFRSSSCLWPSSLASISRYCSSFF